MNNNKQERYIAPSVEAVNVDYDHVLLATSDHHTDFNLAKKNDLFIDNIDKEKEEENSKEQ
jgi:hypothetical protein